jgi:integrase
MALVRMTYRPSEARGLRWSDLSEVHSWDDRKRMAFTLRGTIANAAGGEKWVAQGKTASAIGQTIEVPSYILTLLEKHRVQGCEYVVAPPKKSGKNSTRRTKPFATKHDVEEGWRSLKRLAEVPADVDLYTLKHGLVAELLLQGVKPEVIALLTRHTTINMVMRVYASVQSGDLCDAIDTMHASEFKNKSQST